MPDESDEMIKRIDDRANELDLEVRRFIAETVKDGSSDAETETALTWWIIQKLAGLQILLEELNRKIGRVGTELARRPPPPAVDGRTRPEKLPPV